MSFAGPITPTNDKGAGDKDTDDGTGHGISLAWRRHAFALALATVALLAIFHRDVADIVTIWWTSSTFGHCLLIPIILGWLVWQRWPELRELDPSAWAPGLLPAAAGAVGWLLGDAAGVGLARHFGLILMLQGAIVALLGPRVARALAFPIFYMLFMVPFGEELVPPMQTITAQMCMALLALVGIPAHIDGVFITTPGGYFEVAEACSGVNFLVAMFAFGALAANVCFRSWPRRMAFMALAIVVPVLANGVRAWGTIYIAELTDISFAAGFDHVFYGWFFFAIVMVLVMAIGWKFFDRPRDSDWLDLTRLRAMPVCARPLGLVAAGLLAIGCAPILWSAAMAARGSETIRGPLHMPAVKGWQRVPLSSRHTWYPRFDGADHRLIGRYRNAAGQEADLAIIVFADQREGREIVGYGQGSVDPDSQWAWTTTARAPAGGTAERIIAPGPVVREVVSFYRVGGALTGSGTMVKLETLKARLTGGSRRAVAVLVSSEEANGQSARPAIDALLRDLGPIDALADRIADGR